MSILTSDVSKTYGYDKNKLTQAGFASLGYGILALVALCVFLKGFLGPDIPRLAAYAVAGFAALLSFAVIWHLVGFFKCLSAAQESFVLEGDTISWYGPDHLKIAEMNTNQVTQVVESLRSLPGRFNVLQTKVIAPGAEIIFLEELDGYEELTRALYPAEPQRPDGVFHFRDTLRVAVISLAASFFTAAGLFLPESQKTSGNAPVIVVLIVLGILLANLILKIKNERIELDEELRSYDMWGNLEVMAPLSSILKGAYSGNDRVGVFQRRYVVETDQGRVVWTSNYTGWAALRRYFKNSLMATD